MLPTRRFGSVRPQLSSEWHIDEVELKINGKKHYLWRAVDSLGNVLNILLQSRRDGCVAKNEKE